MALTIIGAVLVVVAVVVAALAVRVALRERERASRADERAIIERDAAAELDRLREYLRRWTGMLQHAGLVRQEADRLALTQADFRAEVAVLAEGLPTVAGLDPETYQRALEHLAERAFSNDPNADRPMSRPYMVARGGQGMLTRPQYDKLKTALVRDGYFDETGGTRSPRLTDRGRAMLDQVRRGRIFMQ